MKQKLLHAFFSILFFCFFFQVSQAQTFGAYATAVWVTDCNQNNFFNTTNTRTPQDLIGPPGNIFTNNNFGVHTQNSGSLILRGGEVKTFKNIASANVCSARMYYRVYLQSGVPGAFSFIDFPFFNNCDVPNSQFPSGGPCGAGDQKWQRVIPNGSGPVNLTANAPGNYVVEVYYEITGSFTSTSQCNNVVTVNNGGSNYVAFFSVQAPTFASTNPVTCNGTEGTITINGLVPGANYSFSYLDDGVLVGPVNITASASGQISLSGLNAGVYSGFTFLINGCSTIPPASITLTNPVFTPTFNAIAPFCAGTTAPVLPGVSNNGYTGTWNPATINNQNSGSYTFTPTAGQCATPVTINVTVTQNVTPTFNAIAPFCAGSTAPVLNATSNNGITGTWNPATIDNQNSGSYTFTPAAGQCATPVTINVNVTQNVTPTFNAIAPFCAGTTAPLLNATSNNGITGTWNPATIDNQTSGSYTFTPTAGQCATPVTINVTVTQNATPTFNAITPFCAGSSAPLLNATSNNGITGTWNPAVINNQNSGTYTFTPAAGQCATPVTINVTVTQNATPTFNAIAPFCSGTTAPLLPGTSTNGITGTWSPATVSNQNSGTYTFTPAAGQCASATTLTITVNTTPSVTVRSDTTVLDGALVPATFFTVTPQGAGFSWVNSNPAIGLAASGTGNVPSFTAVNRGNDNITATITVTPLANGCSGTSQRYVITVRPLNKDIFVPNVFSPNADGKNDQLLVYGNYIQQLEMRIFNQWGEQVALINNRTQGWDGTLRGKPQPVGVYVYVLKATMTDGRQINLKGSITLLR